MKECDGSEEDKRDCHDGAILDESIDDNSEKYSEQEEKRARMSRRFVEFRRGPHELWRTVCHGGVQFFADTYSIARFYKPFLSC